MPTIDVTIEKLIYGGEGLAHHEGSTVFVPFVLPAERAAAEPTEQKKKFIRARLANVLEASPERIEPRCQHFGVCGGCDYQHMPYDSQLKYKTEILRETLRRIGRIEWAGEITVHASKPWGYRNRAQWKVRPPKDAPEGRDTDGDDNLKIGYFRANSTALCTVNDCPILSPLLLKSASPPATRSRGIYRRRGFKATSHIYVCRFPHSCGRACGEDQVDRAGN
jgi:23S rRNA (uracil1939-C5)-methyltransferase